MTYQPLTWDADRLVLSCWEMDSRGFDGVLFSANNQAEKIHLLRLLARSLDRLPPGVEVEIAGGKA